LAVNLTRIAEKDRQTVLINLPNEIAQFLRSLVIPLLIFGGYCIFHRKFILGVIGIIGGGLAIVCCPQLKARHIRRLYASAAALEGSGLARVEVGSLTFLFWDGKFVEAAIDSGESEGAVENERLPV